ncbi:hypothetical protein FEM48_Zijuj07G0039500 [Ziziphus jujuba var. spinosa]|uniref:Uncharacterized protein n=1 Tax=Ziziphus jujuba var. spinosa TaxID=714518 RepID=A0A978V2B1_ZIZJJ|nr:hypothetical protein FEM48_Zijuj07G0039500 [Ziziphus jujuba var. spinosa]
MNETSYFALINLVSNLSFLRKMFLTIRDEQILIFSESVRNKCNFPLPNLKHLKVKVARCMLKFGMGMETGFESCGSFRMRMETGFEEDCGAMLKASYMDLVHLLSNLNFLKKMMQTIWVEEVFIFLKSIKEMCPSPLPNRDHLKVKVRYGSPYKTAKLWDSLLWCAPSLRTLKIVRDRERLQLVIM